MITVDKFLQAIKDNAKRIKEYELGHDGSDGTCDCIGLIIGALRLAGIDYSGTHGSNYFARHCTEHLRKVTDGIRVGDVVYKAYSPGESNYNLPARYKSSGDLLDYYHIGVVMSVNPLSIWHCSGGGMHYDSKIGKWKYTGEVSFVNYKEVIHLETPYIAKVITDSGNLNIRVRPDTAYASCGSIPKGAECTVRIHSTSWDFIEYDGIQGYSSNKYLEPIREISEDEKSMITIPVSTAQKYIETLKDLITLLGGAA